MVGAVTVFVLTLVVSRCFTEHLTTFGVELAGSGFTGENEKEPNLSALRAPPRARALSAPTRLETVECHVRHVSRRTRVAALRSPAVRAWAVRGRGVSVWPRPPAERIVASIFRFPDLAGGSRIPKTQRERRKRTAELEPHKATISASNPPQNISALSVA